MFIAALSATAADDPAVTCRREAFDLAGAWSNDGFRLRDGCWTGVFTPGKSSVVRVNLLAGNRYWFTVAAGATAGELAVAVYTEDGRPVAIQSHRDGTRAAAQFQPTSSGSFLVRVEQSRNSAAPFCLIYSYK